MKVYFDYVVWSNADGREVTKRGGKEMRHAQKLVKQGLAIIKEIKRTFLGYGSSYDTGTSSITYEVTIL